MTQWSGRPWEPAGEPVDPSATYAGPPYGPPPHAYGPPAYGPPAYGPGYGYPPVPYPGRPDPAGERPGLAVAAAVLAFIDAGLLILSGALLLFGASLAASIAESVGDSSSAYSAEFAFDGVLDLVSAGLLIAGGVNMLGGRQVGRVLLTAGSGIVLVEAIYWPARFPVSAVPSTIVWDVLFSALAVLVLIFAWVPTVSRWLRRKAAVRPLP